MPIDDILGMSHHILILCKYLEASNFYISFWSIQVSLQNIKYKYIYISLFHNFIVKLAHS